MYSSFFQPRFRQVRWRIELMAYPGHSTYITASSDDKAKLKELWLYQLQLILMVLFYMMDLLWKSLSFFLVPLVISHFPVISQLFTKFLGYYHFLLISQLFLIYLSLLTYFLTIWFFHLSLITCFSIIAQLLLTYFSVTSHFSIFNFFTYLRYLYVKLPDFCLIELTLVTQVRCLYGAARSCEE